MWDEGKREMGLIRPSGTPGASAEGVEIPAGNRRVDAIQTS